MMQELEKILEEIDHEKDLSLKLGDDGYIAGALDMANAIKDFIRKYMNDGWIPVEERMPEAPEMEDEYPEFNVMIEGAKTPTTLQYTHEGIWVDDYGNVYSVIAWQPLPEPYIPRNQNKPEERYPEWRAKFLNKFDRRL